MAFVDEIISLIDLKTEDDYWDFKETWHDNKASLLHDIICMANNQVGREAYIIIGVSDSKSPDGIKVKGVPETNRKDQAQLITFLRSKKFAGGLRPPVYLQTLNIPDDLGELKPVDVIIIRNTNKTPYFLIEDFKDRDKTLKAGYIYTRIGDTNTPVDTIADLDKIEYLWRKRFGIDLSVNEKLSRLLDAPDDWAGDLNWGNCKYHMLFPEFQIHINDIDDQTQFAENSIMRNIADHQCDKGYFVSEVIITYHSTEIFKEYVLHLDGGRHLIPFPQSETVCRHYYYSIQEPSLTYVYLIGDSIPGKLFNCFARTVNNWYCEKWDLRPGVGFLYFEDDADKVQFDEFALSRLQTIEEEYASALSENCIERNAETEDYFIGGWSKGNEIKARHLFEEYKGNCGDSLTEKLRYLPETRRHN